MKATKGRPGKKSRGKRKARPAKGRAKRAAKKRIPSRKKTAKPRKRASAAAVKSRRTAGKSGSGGKSKSRRPARVGAVAAPAVTAKRGNGRAGSRFRSAALPRAAKSVAGIRRRAVRRDTRLRTAIKAPRGAPGVAIKAPRVPRVEEILTAPALAFLAELHRKFDRTRRALLAARAARQKRFDAGELPEFPIDTKAIREAEWQVAPIPPDLQDRRVEITGPTDRKMIINALNSGATHYMADFEDAHVPVWANTIAGQVNLKDLWHGDIAFTDPESGKDYAVGPNPAVLIVRPRGWHLPESHLRVDGAPISGALFDFGLFLFHNAKAQLARGTGPYFYLPKLESHREARLWTDVFRFAQEKLGLPEHSIKATVLIETLPAAFEMDEMLWEMRDHIVGMNAGRWDFIFSFIKTFANNPNYILPDRGQVVMGEAFLGAYAALLVRTCHHRGAFAMGGMAAQIPVKNDPEANERAFAKVRADKEREVRDGYDGTWVAHPDLVPVAKEVFDRLMPQPNQLSRVRLHVRVLREDFLKIHEGTMTEDGFRLNIRVGVQYIEAWLRGRGAVPIYNLMEDAATAEISRAQIWQQIKYRVTLEDGTTVTPDFFERALAEEMRRVEDEIGAATYAEGRFAEAIELFHSLSLSNNFVDFLTIPAYRLIA
jgi:malate synthase